MERINARDTRWSISLCACTKETIHFTYGNATLHILVEDIRNLGMALQQMDETLKSRDRGDDEKQRSVH
jgi:hypothetical protein